MTSSEAGILLTTYEGLRGGREHLLGVRWGYAILDEGHKIRNPDVEVTLVSKQLATLHRCGVWWWSREEEWSPDKSLS